MRYFIELAYNGKAYHGWQVQPNAITVQQMLERALSTLLNVETTIVGAGRTDTGVHASQMFAHFDIGSSIDESDLKYKLNSFLPKDISIVDIFLVTPEAHARFSATQRTYEYRIATTKDVFDYDYSYYVSQLLDIHKMNDACGILMEYTNFQCFSKTHTDVKTYHCKIEHAEWKKENHTLVFTISADRFLRNMVRAIVGTLINIGLGKMETYDLHDIIASKDRSRAGYSVPAHGLFLTRVEYPKAIALKNTEAILDKLKHSR